MKKILKSFGTWCQVTAWPKARVVTRWTLVKTITWSQKAGRGAKRIHLWSKPHLKKAWTKTKSGGKWAWRHKTEKRVWLSAIILAVLTLLIFGVILAVHTVKALASGNWHMSWLVWIPLAMLGLAMIPLEIIVWILVWQGTATAKTVLTVHGWIMGIIGVPVALIALWVLLKGHLGNAISWYTANIPYPLVVAVAVCLVVVLGIFFLRRNKGTARPAQVSGHGGEGSSRGSGFVALLLVVLLIGLASLMVRENLNGKDPAERGIVRYGGGVEISRVTAPPGENNWRMVLVEARTDMWFSVESETEHIIYHFDGEADQDTWKYQRVVLPPRYGPYRLFLRAKGDKPVEVIIHKSPAVN